VSSSPGRRRVPRIAAPAILAACLLAVACAQAPPEATRDNPLASTRFWERYTDLPQARAMAVAGDPTGIWVGGMAGGMPSVDAALRQALAECGRQRTRRRLRAPCLPYAEGNRVVWGE
jgi:hypothetical protein